MRLLPGRNHGLSQISPSGRSRPAIALVVVTVSFGISLAAQSAPPQTPPQPVATNSTPGASEILLLPVGRTDDPASARVLASGARNAFGNGGLAWEGTAVVAAYAESAQLPIQRIFIPANAAAYPARKNEIDPFQCSAKGPDGFLITPDGMRIHSSSGDHQLLHSVLRQLSGTVPPCAPDTSPLLFAVVLDRILSVIPGVVPLRGLAFTHAAIAPDGFHAAYFYADSSGRLHMCVTDLRAYSVRTAPDPPLGVVVLRYWNPTLAWTARGMSVAYIVRGPKGDGENLWLQEFASTKLPAPQPTQITRFDGLAINSFAFSPDAKYLAVAVNRRFQSEAPPIHAR